MKIRYLVIKYNPLFDKCPGCSQDSRLHRSGRTSFTGQLVTYLTLHRLYRCSSCGWRGFLFTFMFSSRSLTEIFLYTGVAAVACILLSQILSRF